MSINTIHAGTLFVDTTFSPAYNATQLLTMLEHAGYANISYIHHNELCQEILSTTQTVFLVLDYAFLKRDNQKHFLIKNTVKLLQQYVAQPHTKLVLLVPMLQNSSALKRFLSYFGLTYNPDHTSLRNLITSILRSHNHEPDYAKQLGNVIDKSLCHFLFHKPRMVTTALFYAKELPEQSMERPLCPHYDNALLSVECFCNTVQDTLHGIRVTLKPSNSTIILLPLHLLSFTEIEENFHVSPRDTKVRDSMMRRAFTTLKYLGGSQHDIDVTTLLYSNKQCPASQKKYRVAWMDLDTFNLSEKKLQEGVNYIVDANLNLLWITLNPERILSKRIFKEKNVQPFEQEITRFTRALKACCQQRNALCPEIYVNFDVTTNFRAEPVASKTIDLYGSVYTKIPSPLDWDGLWKPEVIEVFDAFYDLWQRASALPLGGIFFDFEMYHAQDQLGSYPNTVDFSDLSWHLFTEKMQLSDAQKVKKIEKRVRFLQQHTLLNTYGAWHRDAMRDIGRRIREHIYSKDPELKLGVYAPTLPATYFMEGITAGLSTPERPILFASFNNDAYMHKPHLQKLGIYAHYLSVMMLSQLREPADFAMIGQLLNTHDGIWFNRFSHLLEKIDDTVWWELEGSPLDPDFVAQEIGKQLNSSCHPT